ncbi:MAG: hypothetical protein ABR532_05810 [Candidatus Dormibacteria bacterium]
MATDSSIQIQRVERRVAAVPIVGTAPLIVHAWSAKAKQMMLDAQQGKKAQKTVKDPEADFTASMYRFENGDHGFPAVGFKSAIVGGARFYDKSISMAALKRLLFVSGEGPEQLVRLETTEPKMREDVVRVGMGTADLRYRAQYNEWRAVLLLTYAPASISLDSVLALVDAGGMGDGIGEWRPEKGGSFGTFTIDDARQIREVSA